MFEAPAVVIAVVEDDEGMRQAMRRLLEAEGFATEVFASAEALLAAGAAERARCLVLDLQLPGMSGVELDRRLRDDGRELPTLFVTGREDLRRNLRVFDRCLVKPFPGEVFIEAVRANAAHK